MNEVEVVVEEDYEEDGCEVEEISNRRAFDIEEDRQRAIALLQEPVGELATYFMSGPTRVSAWKRYMCHATFQLVPEDEVIASCFDDTDVSKEVSDRYWEFLFGADSPWRDLFLNKPAEPILRPDGSRCGFFLEPKKAKEHYGLAYNFVITARMISERSKTVTIWSEFCKAGVNSADAFFLSRMFSKCDGHGLKEDEYIFSGFMNDNCHWPLASRNPYVAREENPTRFFSFSAFRSGRPDHEFGNQLYYGSLQSNGLWRRSLKEPEFDMKSLTPRIINSSYGQKIEVFNRENIIEVFSKTLRKDIDV